MNKQDMLLLYKYNQWTTARILNAAANVTREQFLAPAPFPHGGLRGTLTHAMFAEWIWRNRWEGVSPATRLKPEDFPDFESLRARWTEEEDKLMSFVESLTDEKLNSKISYKTTKGESHERVLWQMMAHVVNHGTQHKTEAAAILTGLGHSPGDIDMILYLIEKG
ncbi:MAG: DinB family protein [Chloroflexi bacterium]|nr:DinB family protein [Chloroflexota bacterium]